MGLLLTDLRADFAPDPAAAARAEALDGRRRRRPSPPSPSAAERWFEHEGIAPAERRLTRTVDMRYHGQNYELGVAVPEGPIIARHDAGAGRRLRRGAPPALRLRRRRRPGADRHAAASRRPAWCARPSFKAHPEAGPDASGAIVAASRRSGWPRPTTSSRRRSTPASGCARQPLRRPRHRRADGRHHPGAARHDGAGRCVSQPDPGGAHEHHIDFRPGEARGGGRACGRRGHGPHRAAASTPPSRDSRTPPRASRREAYPDDPRSHHRRGDRRAPWPRSSRRPARR